MGIGIAENREQRSGCLNISKGNGKCPDEVCSWVQFRIVCGVQISIENVTSLVNKGKTSLIKGMTSKAGKKFDAYIVLNADCSTSFEFEKNKSSKRNGK